MGESLRRRMAVDVSGRAQLLNRRKASCRIEEPLGRLRRHGRDCWCSSFSARPRCPGCVAPCRAAS